MAHSHAEAVSLESSSAGTQPLRGGFPHFFCTDWLKSGESPKTRDWGLRASDSKFDGHHDARLMAGDHLLLG